MARYQSLLNVRSRFAPSSSTVLILNLCPEVLWIRQFFCLTIHFKRYYESSRWKRPCFPKHGWNHGKNPGSNFLRTTSTTLKCYVFLALLDTVRQECYRMAAVEFYHFCTSFCKGTMAGKFARLFRMRGRIRNRFCSIWFKLPFPEIGRSKAIHKRKPHGKRERTTI